MLQFYHEGHLPKTGLFAIGRSPPNAPPTNRPLRGAAGDRSALHLLGLDDGAQNLQTLLTMACQAVDQGVTHIACTAHILPGVYHNHGPDIRSATKNLQVLGVLDLWLSSSIPACCTLF
jgi:hypothetical protein